MVIMFTLIAACHLIPSSRNNGYAISTPVSDTYAGDGIVVRAQGYGMEGVRVDGNDVLAVYKVVQHARRVAVEEQRPVLVEAITLRCVSGWGVVVCVCANLWRCFVRMRSHSTSDDQSLYQDMEEVERWKENNCPVQRLRGYLETRGLWNEVSHIHNPSRLLDNQPSTPTIYCTHTQYSIHALNL